ncbi:MAG TPA: DUF4097 family beta strand repeat-containing protein [Bryobacteraceae bacterium]|jgi:hypothetical protein|nr:DUF4097 family beta strand repeat-containing protein [Bryobacteraceae bacterium]
MNRLALTASLALAALCTSSCDDVVEAFHDSERYREDFHYTRDLRPGGRFSLDNFNGPVEVMAWEKDSVDISGTKYANDESLLKAMRIEISSSPDSISIRTTRPTPTRGRSGARYVIRVPSRVVIDQLRTSNASVRVEGIEGQARLQTSNGSGRVFRIKGPVEVLTSNARVEVENVQGDVRVKTSNGPVRVTDVQGTLEADTSNSGITARVTAPKPNSRIKLDTSNGPIELSLDAFRSNDIVADTSNSSITLRLPGEVSANIIAETSHGSITTDYAVQARRVSKTHLDGSIGSGGPTVHLDTSNGNIRIVRLTR